MVNPQLNKVEHDYTTPAHQTRAYRRRMEKAEMKRERQAADTAADMMSQYGIQFLFDKETGEGVFRHTDSQRQIVAGGTSQEDLERLRIFVGGLVKEGVVPEQTPVLLPSSKLRSTKVPDVEKIKAFRKKLKKAKRRKGKK